MEPKFVVQTDFSLEECEKYNKAMNGNLKLLRIFQAVFTIWTLLSISANLGENDYFGFVLDLVFVFWVILGPDLLMKKRIKDQYNQECLLYGNVSTISFYEDHFETRNLVSHSSYKYSKLCGVIETETNFYLLVMSKGGVIIQKSKCSNELIDFIQKLKK